MNKRTLIIGEHPLMNYLLRKCLDERTEVRHLHTLTSGDIDINESNIFYLLPRKDEECKSFALLAELVAAHDVAIRNRVKLRCYILVQSIEKYHVLQTTDFSDSVKHITMIG